MAENFILLKQKALQIRDEVEDSANSAYRVGGLFKEIVDVFEKHLPPTDQFGDSTEKSVTQKFFTKQVDGRVINNIEISSAYDLNDIKAPGLYKVTFQSFVSHLLVCTDGTSIVQYHFKDGKMLYRTCTDNNWEKWQDRQSSHFVSDFGNSEEHGITQKFFTGLIQNKTLFSNLGIVDETFSDGFSDVTTPGYYTYQKGYNEGEVVNGILIVSNVSYPGAIAQTQVKQELGKTYIRTFDIDERIWGEWTTTYSIYEDAKSNGYVGTKKTFYESLSLIDNISFLKSVRYGDIDNIRADGIYRVYDSDSITNDIMFVTYSSEHDMTKQTYINTNPNFPIPELAYRVYDGEKWSGWSEIGGSKKEVFAENVTVKLSDNKSFGKYVTGDVIHCQGMTAIEVIQMALDETSGLKFNSFLMDISPEQNTGAVISGNKEIRFFLNDQSLARANSLSIIDITANRVIASGLPVTSPVTVDITTVTTGAGQKRQWKATVIEDSTGKTIDSTIYTVTWKAPIIYLYYGEVDVAPESAIVVESGNKIISTNKQFQISAENKVGNFIAFPASMSLKSIENASFTGDWWYNVSTGDDYYNSKQTMTIDGTTYNVWCMIRPLPMGVKANVVFN